MESFLALFTSTSWTTWLFWLLFAFALRVLRKASDPDYFIRHLVVDEKTDKLNQRKVMGFCGFLAALWAFIHYAAPHLMPEWMFALFFLACCLPDLAMKWMDIRRGRDCDKEPAP